MTIQLSASPAIVFLMAAPFVPAAGSDPGATVPGAIHARLLRYPTVSKTQIAFVYAGDIWVVPKSGGTATRLSSPRGEESFPRFSPDGEWLAFTGNYDGNEDIYVMPAHGGLPRRLTFHGAPDRLLNWYPDGKALLFASSRASEKDRFNQLYRIRLEGGLPEKLPVPYGEFGAISPDGKTLAYIPLSVDLRTWKRYRGGMNPDIWLFDLEKLTARNLTRNDANDSMPMWHGPTLYFLSDRDEHKRNNLWAWDSTKNSFRQVTFFSDYDVTFPSIGPDDIVFEHGGRLHLFDLATQMSRELPITVVTDRATLKPRTRNVSTYLHHVGVSPNGKRAVVEARGDLFTVPAENGVVRPLTRSSGVAERHPAWSPDAKWIAYFSDRTGEYELTVRPADGSGEEQTLTKLGPGFRYQPQWSPDSKNIVFIDQAMRIWLHDLEQKADKQIGRQLWAYQGDLASFTVSWSADSRWLAYAGDQENRHSAIILYDVRQDKRQQLTSGFYDDENPVFDPAGQYLFFRSGRTFQPIYSDLDNTWVYPNTCNLLAVPLRKDVASPLAPRNDEETDKEKKPADPEKKKELAANPERKDDPKPADGEKKDEKPPDKKDEKTPKPVEIDVADFERRAIVLPAKPGYYADLAAVSGKLIYRRLSRAGAGEEKTPVLFYDLEKREEKTILDDADGAVLAAKGEKMLVHKRGDFAIIDVKEGQKMDKKLALAGLETSVDPVAEWRQIFTEAWRLERDFFYDPGLHGVDWQGMRSRYEKLLQDATTRWDVNYVIGELIGELNSSHTYRGGGDTEAAEQRGVGYLGCDFSFENGAYRLRKIIDGAPWDSEVRSPLQRPGLTNVQEGDYLLAVNGVPLDPSQEPAAAFQGLADKTVSLTVNNKPTKEGAHEILVQTLPSEYRLRHLAWIEANRRKVEAATGGKAGYVFVPDTGRGGQNELMRQFRGQFNKPALVIDERFNSGGQIPDRFVELLGRRVINYWGVRDGRDWPWPPFAHNGPQVMLINGWSGSGGDCFPYYFKQANLGPLIGLRTWGGLIGMTGAPILIDNGSVSVPTFGIYNPKGEWIIEGYGVDPDIEVVDDPGQMARGGDPQLERAIAEVLKALQNSPPPPVRKPPYPNRAGN
jgi:tricorn protease